MLGWLLCGLLGLALLLLAVLLLGRIQFFGRAAGSVEVNEDIQADEGVLLWLAALDPAVAEALGIDDEAEIDSDVKLSGAVAGHLRLLGGIIGADETGVRLLAWRIRWPTQKRRKTLRTPDEIRELRIAKKERQQLKRTTKHESELDQEPSKRKVDKGAARRDGEPWTLSRVRRLWRPAKRALLRSWSGLGLRLRLRLVYGGEDPATTGLLAGVLPGVASAAFGGINHRRPGSIRFRFVPVFDRQVMAGELELSGDTRLIRLIWPLLRLALRPEFRRLWWPQRRRGRDRRADQQRRSRKEMTA